MALSDFRDTPKQLGGSVPAKTSVPIAAGVTIYKGGLVGGDSAGRAVPATATAADKLCPALGLSLEKYVSTGAGSFQVEIERGVFQFANSGTTDALTIADRGRPCFVVDDQTVARTSSNGARVVAGIVEDVDTDGVWVRVGSHTGLAQNIDITLVAAADLSAKQGFLVKVDTDGKAAVAGAGEAAIGVLVNAPAAAAIAVVRVAGVARAIAGGAVTKGDRIAADAAGKTKTAVAGKVDTSDAGAAADPVIGSNVLGIALETGVLDALHSILITQSGAVPTTAA